MNTRKKPLKPKNGFAENGTAVLVKNKVSKLKQPAIKALTEESNYDNRELLHVLNQVKNGNFSVRMPIDETGINGKICDTLNEIIALNEKNDAGVYQSREYNR